jgi:hypothetical protein
MLALGMTNLSAEIVRVIKRCKISCGYF